MHVLVLGGCGYIGSVLVSKLLKDNHSVTVVDTCWFGCPLMPHEKLTLLETDIRNIDLVNMNDVDAVVHLANIANDPCGNLDSKLVWEVNVLATMALVEKAIQHGVKKFIYSSSGSVYGIKEEQKVTEELPLLPISDYNKTKMISERILLSYQDDINLTIIRPATVCGYAPRTRLDVTVNLLTMQALKNGSMRVLGGSQTRPNIHIQDVTDCFCHFLYSSIAQERSPIYNAGFENLSILDIANKVAEKIPAKIEVAPSNDPRSYRLCSNKLLNLGFSPKYTVDDAIDELAKKYHLNTLKDNDYCHNVRTMKKLFEKTSSFS